MSAPDFSTWSRENLEKFAREAYAKLAEQQKAERVPILREPLDCQGIPATAQVGKVSK